MVSTVMKKTGQGLSGKEKAMTTAMFLLHLDSEHYLAPRKYERSFKVMHSYKMQQVKISCIRI